MSKILASLLLLASATIGKAQVQGQVDFANGTPGCNAPISDAAGYRIIGPNSYVADLFWSLGTNASMDSLTPAGHNTQFSSASLAGYFFGGAIALPSEYVLAQVRVWDTSFGSTYYEARDIGGEFGFSNLIIVLPFPPPGGPAYLTGLQSFQLQRLPYLSISTTLTNTLLFSWPTNITSYVVQQNTSLDSINWTTLTNTSVVVGAQNQVAIPKPEQSMFYRLISQ